MSALEFAITLRRGSFTLDLCADLLGRTLAVFGPSGSGKSTLLACIAGLSRPEAGRITVGGETWFDAARGIHLPPERRAVGLVPQEGLLFPHLDVRANLLFGADRKRRGDAGAQLHEVTEVLEIGPLLGRRPDTLSGGERQRVALGRALLSAPKLLLFDEPLAAVDQALKRRILPYLTRALDHFRIPALYVSHDPAEVLAVTRELLVIRAGRAVAAGDWREIVDRPDVYAAFSREGIDNVLEGTVEMDRPAEGYAEVRSGSALFRVPPGIGVAGATVQLTVKAGDIILSSGRPPLISARNVLEGNVLRLADVDGLVLVHLDVGCELLVELTPAAVRELALAPGAIAWALIKSNSFDVRIR